jgi:hypothetical protein
MQVALLLVKIMEDFLDDDIKFNWVQVFNSEEALLPDFIPEEDMNKFSSSQQNPGAG